MIDIADEEAAGGGRAWGLGVAAEAEVGIAHGEEPGVDGAMGIVATGATFAQGRVLENDRLGLRLMAGGARLVQPRHGQPSRPLHDVRAVRIVALPTVHFAFKDGVMPGQMEFRLGVEVALETGGGVPARIDDEVCAGRARGDVFAGRAVARFASILPGHARLGQTQPGVRTGGKDAGDIGVAIGADLVTHVGCAVNLRRGQNRPAAGGAGIQQDSDHEAQGNPVQATGQLMHPPVSCHPI